MTNLLLEGSFFSNLWSKMIVLFGQYNFWIALGVAVLGGALLILAKRLTRVHRGVDMISSDDKVLLTYRILAIVCIVFAIIVWIFFC